MIKMEVFDGIRRIAILGRDLFGDRNNRRSPGIGRDCRIFDRSSADPFHRVHRTIHHCIDR